MPRPSARPASAASPARREQPARPTLTALRLSLAVAALAAMIVPAQAAQPKPYADPRGRYTLEVPEGFKPKNVTESSAMFESRDGNGWFTIAVMPGVSSLDMGMTISTSTFGKVMPNAAADGEPLSMDVGGSPARWVVYRGNIVAAGQSVPMVGLGGALALPGCTVTLTTAMTNDSHAKYGDVVLTAFRSLRAGTRGSDAGAELGSAGAAAPAPAPVKGKPVPYQDPDGRFAIDLPPGFAYVSTEGGLAKFEGDGGGWFQLAFLAGVSDLDAATGLAGKTFQKILPDAVAEPPQDLEVNGRPARWMVRRGDMKLPGATVKAVGLGGAVTLTAGSLALVTVLTADSHAKWGEAITASFKSLRAGMGTATGTATGTVKKEAFGATSTVNADGTTTFSHPAGSFDLPPGWRVGKPEGEAAFAQFNNRNGASLTFNIGPRGYRSNKAMCEASEDMIHRALPQMQLQPPGHYEVDSQRNNKVSLARFKGPMTFEGRELEALGFTAWGKAARGFIVGFGMGIGPTAPGDLEEMEKIARTLR